MTVMEYNKDLFDEAGVAYPTVDWTTDDFLDKAAALTEGEDEESKQYGFVSQTFETSDLLLFLDRLGANLVDESSEPPAFDFTNPGVAEAVRWYTNLTTEYEVKPVFLTEIGAGGSGAFQRRQTLLQDNRAAMWSSTGFDNIATFGEEEADEERRIGVVPFPTGPDGSRRGSYQSGNGYFISAETEARQACWTWLTFLSEHPTSETALPARRATAESAEYRQLVGEERAAAYLASIAEATEPAFFQRLTQENSWMGLSFFWLTQAYDQILNDGLAVEEALENAQETAETYRACIIAAEAFSDPEGQQACAQEADDSLPGYMFSAPDEDEDE
jgi:multiple sugar transport system substrate-binding protein